MIGIFDSGLGGLTVVKEILKVLPEYQFLYFGDTARFPYGTKGKDVVITYAKEDTELLLNKGAKLIVVACNTASAIAAEELKKKFDLPIFEVISPAVKKAVEVTKNKRIGVIGTRGTINNGVYEKLIKEIDPEIKVFHQACPLFVFLAEEGWLDKPETKTIAKKYLTDLKRQQIDTLILGCTHYPLLKKILKQVAGKKIESNVHHADTGAQQVVN